MIQRTALGRRDDRELDRQKNRSKVGAALRSLCVTVHFVHNSASGTTRLAALQRTNH